jgi:hypothetical protein
MNARIRVEEEKSFFHTAHSQTAGADTGELSGCSPPGHNQCGPGANLQEGSDYDNKSQQQMKKI